MTLKSGQSVRTESSGLNCEVEQLLGGGGQGEVYRAMLEGKPVAIKWYFPASATSEQRAALQELIIIGAPNDKFLWPLELVSATGTAGFGYLMPLRPNSYKSLFELMQGRIDPSFRALATAGLIVAHSFLQLHAKGLAYRDISFGNVFFKPDSGDVLICDNDNVAVDASMVGGVYGTPNFMAPEIVRGESSPSTQTDLFSLAVLLFYMFHIHHPLFGRKVMTIRCLDLPARTKLCGLEPLFIFDPHDHANEALPRSVDPTGEAGDNALRFWPIYPQFLRDLFTRAFTEGLRDPTARVRESEWRAAMVRLRDAILFCQRCSSENFYDPEALKNSGGKARTCWSCGRDLVLPPQIRIGKNTIVMLNHNTQLFPHHVDDNNMYDFSHPIAAVAQHPINPAIWGLKNLSTEKWVSVFPDGTVKDVEPGRSVTLAVNTKVEFGNAEGVICRQECVSSKNVG
jgi:serine/threonine protein kinase